MEKIVKEFGQSLQKIKQTLLSTGNITTEVIKAKGEYPTLITKGSASGKRLTRPFDWEISMNIKGAVDTPRLKVRELGDRPFIHIIDIKFK